MPRSFRYLPFLLVAALALGGCGNKGPLVQPDQVPTTKSRTTSPQTTPADAKSHPDLPH